MLSTFEPHLFPSVSQCQHLGLVVVHQCVSCVYFQWKCGIIAISFYLNTVFNFTYTPANVGILLNSVEAEIWVRCRISSIDFNTSHEESKDSPMGESLSSSLWICFIMVEVVALSVPKDSEVSTWTFFQLESFRSVRGETCMCVQTSLNVIILNEAGLTQNKN